MTSDSGSFWIKNDDVSKIVNLDLCFFVGIGATPIYENQLSPYLVASTAIPTQQKGERLFANIQQHQQQQPKVGQTSGHGPDDEVGKFIGSTLAPYTTLVDSTKRFQSVPTLLPQQLSGYTSLQINAPNYRVLHKQKHQDPIYGI